MKKGRSILIFAANLHKGGGVAVASSFIKELSDLIANGIVEGGIYNVCVSREINENLVSMNVDTDVFASFSVKDFFGIKGILKGVDFIIKDYQTVFTIFGPLYSIFKPLRSLVGFAQPWMIYPESPAWKHLNILQRFKFKSKLKVQQWFFSRADKLIVELPHVEKRLNTIFPDIDKEVVHSCIDSVYKKPSSWLNIDYQFDTSSFKIGLVSRNYPHKNLNFFGEVAHAMKTLGYNNVKFYLTLNNSDYDSLDDRTKESVHNVGPLKLGQCPTFYEKVDAILFPTLLECFSAVAIESLYLQKPLITNNLPFMRDVCGNSAFYMNNNNLKECVEIIENLINGSLVIDKSESRKVASAFGYSKRRALEYISITESELKK